MSTPRILVAVALVGAIAMAGCRHTWDGAKTDTKRAVQKTGHGIEKAGKKIEGAPEKK